MNYNIRGRSASFYLGLDLGQQQDPTAIAIISGPGTLPISRAKPDGGSHMMANSAADSISHSAKASVASLISKRITMNISRRLLTA